VIGVSLRYSMNTSLALAAQTLLDLYYQDYAPEGAFIDLSHVKLLMYSEYERILQQEYKQAKILNKSLEGFGFVTLDGDTLIVEIVDIVKEGSDWVGTLNQAAFAFNFDTIGTSVQRVRSTDSECNSELIRIPANEAWAYCVAPATKQNFFYTQNIAVSKGCPATTKIYILGQCHPKQVEVQYLPALTGDGDVEIATRYVKSITDSVLQSLLIAKKEVVVDKTSDQNPNTALPTEANPDHIKENP
jgi:hypothetical protein